MTDNSTATRLGRVVQQLRSFGELHGNELEGVALELEAAGAHAAAARLRAYRDVQRDESQIVVDELVDIQHGLIAGHREEPTLVDARDPAVNSSRRAKWLADQTARVERLRQPRSRRDLFGRAPARTDDAP